MSLSKLHQMKEEIELVTALVENIKTVRSEMPDASYAALFRHIGSTLPLKRLEQLSNVMQGMRYPQVDGVDMLGGYVNTGYTFGDGTAALVVMAGGKIEIHTFDSIHDIESGYSNEMTQPRKLRM